MYRRENAFNLPFRITYRPPLILVYLMMFSHAGSLFCLFFASLPAIVLLTLAGFVCSSFIFFIHDFYRQRNAEDCPQLLLDRQNNWSLTAMNNEAMPMRLRPGALVHRLMLVLRFTGADEKPYCFVLNHENVDGDTLRRLRVRLLHSET